MQALKITSFFSQSIKRLIMASFTFVLLLPIGFFIYSLQENSWERAQLPSLEKHSLIAKAMVEPFKLYISSRQQALQIIGEDIYDYEYSSTPKTFEDTNQKINDILNKFRLSANDIVAVSYQSSLRHNFKNISTNSINPVNVDIPDYSKLSLAKLPLVMGTSRKQIDLLSPLFRSDVSGSPVVLLKHYIHDNNNKIVGAIYAEISLTFVAQICSNISFGKNGHCAILDSTGHVIAHPNEDWISSIRNLDGLSIAKKMMNSESGTTEFYSPFKEADMVAGFATIEGLGWGIMIPQPKSELTKPLDDIKRSTLLWLSLGLFFAMLIAFYLINKITNPISDLMRRTREVDAGYDFISIGSIPKNSPNEIKQLWLSISVLLSKLQKSNNEVKKLNVSLSRDVKKATNDLRVMNKKLYHLSHRDHLTSLANRRYFNRYLKHILTFKREIQIGILLIDIDKFKLINDTYGHEAGDLALKYVAKTLKESIRKADLVARLGGDEFVVYIEDANERMLKAIAESIRHKIETHSISWQGKPLKLTLSIGIYNVENDGKQDLMTLLTFADKAMYQSKLEGRNNISLYKEDSNISRQIEMV